MTLVCIIVDCSGSMGRQDTVDRVNAFLARIRNEEPEAQLQILRLAEGRAKILRCPAPLTAAVPLRESECRFKGLTALLDGLGESIQILDRQSPGLVAVVTDGVENFSKVMSRGQLLAAFEARRARGWKFEWLMAGEKELQETRELIGALDNAWKFRSKIRNWLLRRMPRRIDSEIEDVVQETMLALLMRREAIANVKVLEHYMCTIAYRYAAQLLDKSKPFLNEAEFIGPESDLESIFDLMKEHADSVETTLEAIDEEREWSQRYKQRLLLIPNIRNRRIFDYIIQGASFEEAAQHFDVSKGTVRAYMNEARKKFFAGSVCRGIHMTRILGTKEFR